MSDQQSSDLDREDEGLDQDVQVTGQGTQEDQPGVAPGAAIHQRAQSLCIGCRSVIGQSHG